MNAKSLFAALGLLTTATLGFQTTKILPNRVSGGSSGNVLTSDGASGQWSSSLPGSVIGSGQVGLARGGTNADLSATGGTGYVLKQATAGAAISVGALVAADIPSLDASKITSGTMGTARLGSGTASSSTFLRGDQTWASVSASPAGSDTQIQYNSSGSFGASSNLIFDSNNRLITGGVTPTSTTTIATFGATATGASIVESRAKGANVARFSVYADTFVANTGGWGQFVAGYNVAGSAYTGGGMFFIAAENHDSTHLGTDWNVALDKKGATSVSNRFRVTSEGNVVTNDIRTAVSTSATDGFLYLPTCAGKPTGTPTSYTGNAAAIYDSTDQVIWVYTGSAWQTLGPTGTLKAVSTTYTMTAANDLVECNLDTASYTVTLPASNSVPVRHPYKIFYVSNDSGISHTLTIARAGSDTINGLGFSITKSLSSGTFAGFSFVSDGSGWIETALNP